MRTWIERSLAAQVAIALVVTFIVTGAAFGILYHKQERESLQHLMLKEAQALFNQVHLMRHWNAGYQGVYVLKRPGMETNPYLYKVGPGPGKHADIRPEIQDTQGNTYTLKNPALMTRELAEITERESDIRFHLTSLKLINPHNKPDPFEAEALKQFEQGAKEWHQQVEGENGPRFRYMAPLRIEQGCLQCHGFQGYKLDDIRGGLSFDLPMQSAIEITDRNRQVAITGGLVILSAMLLALWFTLNRRIVQPILDLQKLARKIGTEEERHEIHLASRRDEIGSLSCTLIATEKEVARQQQELVDLAERMDQDRRHDPLTKLHNRRHLYLEGPNLFAMAQRLGYEVSVMMIDLDHFKQINDTYGHAAGDTVLVDVATTLMKHCRSYDLLIRFGGEEFTLVLLNCDQSHSIQIGERIRQDLQAMRIEYEGVTIPVTCSIGISSGRKNELEQMVLHADEAVYMAKAAGRNRVQHINETH